MLNFLLASEESMIVVVVVARRDATGGCFQVDLVVEIGDVEMALTRCLFVMRSLKGIS